MVGGSYYENGRRRIPKKVLNGKFHKTRPVGNQEQEGKTLSRWTHHRPYEYEDGGDEQKTEKNRGVF